MAHIGQPGQKVCGRQDRPLAKTKARQSREIDVLIFPLEERPASERLTFVPFRRLRFVPAERRCEVPLGGASAALLAAGGSCVKRGGYDCYKFQRFCSQGCREERLPAAASSVSKRFCPVGVYKMSRNFTFLFLYLKCIYKKGAGVLYLTNKNIL